MSVPVQVFYQASLPQESCLCNLNASRSAWLLYVFWRSDVCVSSPLSLSHFYSAYSHSVARCTPHSPVLKTEYEKQGVWPAQRSRSSENSPVDSDHPQPVRPKLTHGQPAQMSDVPAQCLCSVVSGTSMHTVWQRHFDTHLAKPCAQCMPRLSLVGDPRGHIFKNCPNDNKEPLPLKAKAPWEHNREGRVHSSI